MQKKRNERKPKQSQKNRQEAPKNFSLQPIQPITDKQNLAFSQYGADKHLVLHGSAGTGKSFLALYLALKDVLDPKCHQDKIIIVRSAVQTRDVGFLPGTSAEKAAIYELPYQQICSELFKRGDAYDILKQKGVIQFITTSFVRGLTFHNAIVIADEIQNCSDGEINTIITRLAESSRIILCGDTVQCDLHANKKVNETGIHILLDIVSEIEEFALVEFGVDDIVRGDLVARWIRARNSRGLV